MSLIHQMNEWSSKHHPKWLVILRVALGLCLFFKGFGFIQNSVELTGFFSATSYFQKATWLNTVIPWIHLLGGSMIIVGLFTRLWTLVQIPILLGAIFFINTFLSVIKFVNYFFKTIFTTILPKIPNGVTSWK